MSDSAPFPPPNSPLEIARHELGHAFMAQHLGKTVRLITILDPSLCLHEPDAKTIIERDEPLSDSDRTRIGEDLKITVAGPVATALSREQSEAKIRGSTGLTSLGGASDAYRFCWAAARLYGGTPELCYEDEEIRLEDEDFIEMRAEEERKARASVLKVLTEAVWVRIKAEAEELLDAETLDGNGLRVLMRTLLSP